MYKGNVFPLILKYKYNFFLDHKEKEGIKLHMKTANMKFYILEYT